MKIFLVLAASALLLVIGSHVQFLANSAASAENANIFKPHPLPPTLVQWYDPSNSGDYFAQVKPTAFGYLIWSQLPVKVYIKQLEHQTRDRIILQAVSEWSAYLPLVVVAQPENADISIEQSRPRLQIAGDKKLPRARAAETSYEIYTDRNNVLSHRCKILLSPNLTDKYLLASARHELGHALGIWGHSPQSSDALYFSQMRSPPQISARDINTLKRIYQQPTRLGWNRRSSE